MARPGVAAGGVAYVSAEDDAEELHRRLAAICGAAGCDLAELDLLELLPLAGRDAVLAVPEMRGNRLRPTDLWRQIEERVAVAEPALVVFDTLSDLWSGDENNRAQARQFVGLLRGLALRFDCACLLLAHPSLTGLNSGSGLSGSTAWSNSVRSRMTLERIAQDGHETDPHARVLRLRKANYAPAGAELRMRWTAGAFAVDGAETGLDAAASGAMAARVFVDLLRLHMAQGRYVSASPGPTFAPTVFAKHPDAEGVTRRAFNTAMETMLRAGRLRIAEHGRASKARKHLEEVRDDD